MTDCVEPIGAGAIKSGRRVGGLREGLWRVYYPDGTLWSEQSFVSDKLHGWVRSWAPDGRLSSEIEYEKGLLHGTSISYFPDGAVWRRAAYARGKELGPYIIYARDGSILAEGIASPESPPPATSQVTSK